MGTFRLYTGSDNESHIDPIDLSQTPEWLHAQDTTDIRLREGPGGKLKEWQPGPWWQV